jgi:putative transcriptional regulator
MKTARQQQLAEKMAGEITLADSPGFALKKWRVLFEIPPGVLAERLGVSPSVISDYESGRRKSPGTAVVGKIVDAILTIDEEKGGVFTQKLGDLLPEQLDAAVIFDIHEYASPVSLTAFAKVIDAQVLHGSLEQQIYGYTVIHSLNAILQLSSNEFSRLYGWSTERALVFVEVSNGKSPMVAIRVTPFKPRCVVLQGIATDQVHPLVPMLAEKDRITVLCTQLNAEQIVKALRSEPW